MAALASYWLRQFRPLLWDRWIELNETWQEAGSQRPLPSLCFSGLSENKMTTLDSDWLRHFLLLLWNHRTELTKLDRRHDLICNILYQVCVFCADWKNKMTSDCIGWDISASPLKPMNKTERNLTGSKISTSSTKFVFFRAISKQNGHPSRFLSKLAHCTQVHDMWPFGPLVCRLLVNIFFKIVWDFCRNPEDIHEYVHLIYIEGIFSAPEPKAQVHYFDNVLCVVRLRRRNFFIFTTSPLKPLNGIKRNFTGSKISTSSTKFVFFRLMGKTRWLPRPLIGWDIFHFSSITAEPNSTKLDRKQDLKVLYQVCVFWADWKNKMAALASDRLRYFQLLLWNRWTEFNET